MYLTPEDNGGGVHVPLVAGFSMVSAPHELAGGDKNSPWGDGRTEEGALLFKTLVFTVKRRYGHLGHINV
jgi:hypothetical protein